MGDKPRTSMNHKQVCIDLLDDGEWHHRDDVLNAMMRAVSPEYAAEQAHRRWNTQGVEIAIVVGRGRRLLATRGLGELVRAGRVEQRGDGWDAEVRACWT